MASLYFDASAAVKLVIDEEGSGTAARLWDTADLVTCSPLGYTEVRAALSAAARAHRVTADAHDRCVDAWTTRYWPSLAQVALTPALAVEAGDAAHRHSLRGADAIHLTSALQVPDVVLVTWDVRLREGASAAGVRVAPAELTPAVRES